MIISEIFNLDNNVENIHKATVRILSEIGVKFGDERAIHIFEKNGAKVESDKVYITEDMLEKALSTTKKSFRIRGRDRNTYIEIGNGNTVFSPTYGPVFVKRDKECRLADKNDYVNFIKMSQSSDLINLVSPYVVTPSDIEAEKVQSFQQAVCLKYSDKPIMCISSNYKDSKDNIRMIKEFYDSDDLEYVTIGLISSLTPLSYDEAMTGSIIAYAEENQPIIFGCGAMPGATSPVTLSGTIAMANAELLAGIVLSQLIKPGLPVVYANVSNSTDLRYVTPAIGAPETSLITMYSRAMSSRYGLPCRAGGALSDAKDVDIQAGIESTILLYPTILCGADIVLHSCGILDSFNIVSYEKFLIDQQTIKQIQRVTRGFTSTEDEISIDTIKSVGHNADYLMEMHTMKYARNEHSVPEFFNRQFYEIWEKEGCKTPAEIADEKVDKILKEYKIPELTDRQLEIVEEYLGGYNV